MRSGLIILCLASLLIGAIVSLAQGRKSDYEQQAQASFVEALSSIRDFDDDREFYLRLADEAHLIAFDNAYQRSRLARPKLRRPQIFQEQYRPRAWNAMIRLAEEEGRQDLVVKLHQHRGKVGW